MAILSTPMLLAGQAFAGPPGPLVDGDVLIWVPFNDAAGPAGPIVNSAGASITPANGANLDSVIPRLGRNTARFVTPSNPSLPQLFRWAYDPTIHEFPRTTNSVTVECWLRATALPNSVNHVVQMTTAAPYSLALMNDGRVQFIVRNETGSAANLFSGTALVMNRWYHIAGVSTPTGRRIYIDGVLDSTGMPAIGGTRYAGGAGSLRMWQVGGLPNFFFVGAVSSFRITRGARYNGPEHDIRGQ